jgi:ubiquinone/menaquinone biosynthesis C-methylase UbiE
LERIPTCGWPQASSSDQYAARCLGRGGWTIRKLSARATEGKVYGIDNAPMSVAVAQRTNRRGIARGRVDIREGSVSRLPFSDDMFDLVAAVETHFWWPDLPADLREVVRVLRPGGQLLLLAQPA